MIGTAARDGVSLRVVLPAGLHKRAGRVAKRHVSSISELLRQGLVDRVEFLEAKERAEIERRHKEKQSDRVERRLKALGERPIEKKTISSETTTRTTDDPLVKIYSEHARLILGAEGYERRLRVHEALKAVRAQCPLTYPSDGEILALLEQSMREQRAEMDLNTETSPESVMVNRVINPENVKTFGQQPGEGDA